MPPTRRFFFVRHFCSMKSHDQRTFIENFLIIERNRLDSMKKRLDSPMTAQ